MAGYGRRDPSGWDVAMQGLNFLNNSMRTGQAIGEQRYQNAERDGVNQALEHIAGKLGNQGDISVLDGDPVLNTRHGTMAMGQFMQQRANTETSRLQMLKAMEAADDQFYQKTFRPMAFAAQEAFKAGDMQRFGGIASELAAKSPMPYRLVPGQDGNLDVEFRSDAAGGWTRTNRRLTPQEAMTEINNIMAGEQTILAGADMKPRTVNPRFLAASSRYKMGTIMGNAEALADPKKWIPLTKGGHTVYAIPQNRHDDYSAGPSYRVLDEKGGTSAMIGSLDELVSRGYVRSDVKASTEKAQRLAAGGGSGTGVGSSPYKLSESDKKWIAGQASIKDEFGNETTNPAIGMALEILMGMYGQSQYSALQAYQNGVKAIIEQLRREAPNMPADQMQQFAAQRYCDFLRERGQGWQPAQATQATGGNAQQAQGYAPQAPVSGADQLRDTVRGVAGGIGQASTPVEEEPITPEERHRQIVEGGVELTRGIPGAIRNGFEWWKDSIKNNAE